MSSMGGIERLFSAGNGSLFDREFLLRQVLLMRLTEWLAGARFYTNDLSAVNRRECLHACLSFMGINDKTGDDLLGLAGWLAVKGTIATLCDDFATWTLPTGSPAAQGAPVPCEHASAHSPS